MTLKDSLYEPFKKWALTGPIWLYSDPHFNDPEMPFIRKNYIGDEEQIKRINSKVGKKDTLIILGDVGDIEFVKKLKGYKVLIMGNHDKGASNYKRQKLYDLKEDDCTYKCIGDNHLFDEVYEGPLMINDRLILSHEPIFAEYPILNNKGEVIELVKAPIPYIFNIHGHDHSNWQGKDNYHLNVCAEHINYTPVSLSSMIKDGLFKYIESIHRLTIDKATERKKNK